MTIGEVNGGFAGRVRSPARRCLGARTVLVYMVTRTRPTLVANEQTTSDGRYVATPAFVSPGDSYYARVLRSNLGHAICKAAQSRTIVAR